MRRAEHTDNHIVEHAAVSRENRPVAKPVTFGFRKRLTLKVNDFVRYCQCLFPAYAYNRNRTRIRNRGRRTDCAFRKLIIHHNY